MHQEPLHKHTIHLYVKTALIHSPAETLLAPSCLSSSACLLPTLQKVMTYKSILRYTNTRPYMYTCIQTNPQMCSCTHTHGYHRVHTHSRTHTRMHAQTHTHSSVEILLWTIEYANSHSKTLMQCLPVTGFVRHTIVYCMPDEASMHA